jgi:SnoaL-like domain
MESTLPTPVAGYVAATNAFDLDALIACFADDAFVNDARREFWGKDVIRRWLDRELIGDKVTMAVTAISEHYGVLKVDAVMDGEYDKTGLPDPLILTHYFTVRDDQVVGLVIVHNQPTPAWATG